jgi:PAS domain S-box-containing protein
MSLWSGDRMMRHEKGNETDLLRYLSALRKYVERSNHAEFTNGSEEGKESDHIFRAIFENAADGILLVDVKSKRFYIGNRVLCQMLGYGPQELQTLEISDIHPEKDLPYITEQFEKQVKEELTLATNIPVRRKDGSVFYADINAFPITFGRKTYLMGIFRDITRRRNAEEKLRRSEETFRLAMEATNDALWDWNITTNEVYRNPRQAAMLGYEPHELTTSQKEWEKRIHPGDKPFVLGVVEELLQGKRDYFNVEYRLLTKSGDYIWVLGRGKIVAYNDDGSPVRMVGTNVDITHRKKMEAALAESEEKYRTLVESSADAISIIDGRGVFLFANRKTADVTGIQRKELVGKTMWDFFPKEVADRRIAAVRRVIESKQEMSIIRQTELRGQLFWYHTKLLPIGDGHGETVVMAVSRDVSDIKQAEERIRVLSSAVEQSIDGIAIGDLDRNLCYVNAAYAHMHGYTSQEMIGMRITEVQNSQKMDEYRQIIQHIEIHGSWTGEIEHIRKDGTVFPCYMSITSLKNEQGLTTGRLAVCRDISEFKKNEKELTTYRNKMAHAEQLVSLGTLSATIVHQLTQPLTVIRLSLDNVVDELERTTCSSTVLRRLRDSVAQVSSITTIINRFRNFARQSSDTDFGQVNVYAVTIRVARLLAESAKQARVKLHVEDLSKLPPIVLHEREFEQILFALIENAIQAADGEEVRRIVISGHAKDEYIELRFTDNCGGITPENLDKIFEPFFTTKPRGQGTGLGLCIVRDAVARVGGRVCVESKFGKGSTFFVTLPVDED